MIWRPIRDWMRAINPFEYVIVIALVLAGLILGKGAIGSSLGDRQGWEMSRNFLLFPVGICTFLYAVLRAVGFHPLENRPYGTWLATTPWRYPQPLPYGPITLVWQDVVILGVLTALCPGLYVSRLIVPIGFLLVYSLTLTAYACRVGIYWSVYAVLFLFGCIFLAFDFRWLQLGIAVAAYGVAYVCAQQVLRRWPYDRAERELLLTPERQRFSQVMLLAGWPMPPQRVERFGWSVSQHNAACIALVVGWLVFSVFYPIQDGWETEAIMQRLLNFLVVVLVLARLGIYLLYYLPPISLLGRIATGRLIVPGFDVVLVAAVVVVAVSWGLMQIAESMGIATLVAVPVTAAFSVWLALALPPRREEWQLTGHHRVAYRLRAAMMQANSRQMKR